MKRNARPSKSAFSWSSGHESPATIPAPWRGGCLTQAGKDFRDAILVVLVPSAQPALGSYLDCLFANRTLIRMLIAAMPAKNTSSAESSPLEIFPTRNRM